MRKTLKSLCLKIALSGALAKQVLLHFHGNFCISRDDSLKSKNVIFKAGWGLALSKAVKDNVGEAVFIII